MSAPLSYILFPASFCEAYSCVQEINKEQQNWQFENSPPCGEEKEKERLGKWSFLPKENKRQKKENVFCLNILLLCKIKNLIPPMKKYYS